MVLWLIAQRALAEAKGLEAKVKTIGENVSSNYADSLEAHMRQMYYSSTLSINTANMLCGLGGFQVAIPTQSLDTNRAI